MEYRELERTCIQAWWSQMLFGLPSGLPPEAEAAIAREMNAYTGFAVLYCHTGLVNDPSCSTAARTAVEEQLSRSLAGQPDLRILCMGWTSENMYAILHGAQLDKKTLQPLLMDALTAIRASQLCHMAVSSAKPAAEDVPACYHQVSDMLDYAILVDKPVFFAEDLPPVHYDLSCRVLKSRLETDYMQAIAEREFIVAYHCLERLTAQELDEDMRAIRRLKHRLLARVETAMQLMGIAADDPNEEETYRQMFARAAEQSSMRGLLAAVREIYSTLDQLARHQATAEKGQPDQILRFLDNHYTDASLDLTRVAETFGVSKSYISRIVNRYGGSSFTDYLSALRIGEAKELLKNSQMTVQDICEKVGYTNRWTLLRAFRRFVGMTPQEYRAYTGNT